MTVRVSQGDGLVMRKICYTNFGGARLPNDRKVSQGSFVFTYDFAGEV
jgi:hypothetical protein